ncbi:BQ2448_5300 [Microbotryum intermedium]|uniref:Translation initiation factor eIF2B subunit delta n=1 Tax=Microbotryum intermedium TaxID=269621 RepID=A0A238F4P8_9BASI|nr:BQ2448_5300 [Microbotryum intermedium]
MSSPKPAAAILPSHGSSSAAGPAPTAAVASPAGGAKVDKAALKAAKAAKRAAAKGLAPGQPASPTLSDASFSSKKSSASTNRGPNNQSKSDQHASTGASAVASTSNRASTSNAATGGAGAGAGATGATPSSTTGARVASASAIIADPLSPFLHLELPSSSSSLSHSSKSSTANIHPSILRLALQYAEFKIVGANARCIAMLEALKDIIASYTPPAQTSLTRHLPTTHLNPQINHLVRARPLSVSMGTAIRYLKYEISLIEMETDVEEAKAMLISKIDSFVRDRILLADKVIEQHACEKIKDGDTILTYARSSVVEGVLLEAKRQGKDFSVVVVDSRPLNEGELGMRGEGFNSPGKDRADDDVERDPPGKNLLISLRAAQIPTTYVLLPSLSLVLPRVSLCLLGTHALLSNGSMFSRAGTAMVAMMLREKGVPVVCCCETYKFSERIMLDSIVGNEMATPQSLLEGIIPSTPTANLSPLSLLYDVARPEDVTVVITEAGLIPVQSVPVLLRDYKPLAGGGL